MNCRTSAKYLPLYVGHDLPDKLYQEVGLHLLECEQCQAQLSAYQKSTRAVAELRDQPIIPPALRTMQHNIRHRVHSESLRSAANGQDFDSRFYWGIRMAGAASAVLIVVSAVMLYQVTYFENTGAEQLPNQVAAKAQANAAKLAGIVSETNDTMLTGLDEDETEIIETFYPLERVRSLHRNPTPPLLPVRPELPRLRIPSTNRPGSNHTPIPAKLVNF